MISADQLFHQLLEKCKVKREGARQIGFIL